MCARALPGSVLITRKVPELAFFEPSLHYQLQEDKTNRGDALFLEMYLLQRTVYPEILAAIKFGPNRAFKVVGK